MYQPRCHLSQMHETNCMPLKRGKDGLLKKNLSQQGKRPPPAPPPLNLPLQITPISVLKCTEKFSRSKNCLTCVDVCTRPARAQAQPGTLWRGGKAWDLQPSRIDPPPRQHGHRFVGGLGDMSPYFYVVDGTPYFLKVDISVFATIYVANYEENWHVAL